MNGAYEKNTDALVSDLSKIARLITEANRGNETTLSNLANDFDAYRLIAVVEFGRAIGALHTNDEVEHSFEDIRFEHQRAQEYFTALNLVEDSENFDWKSHLDEHWWQETLVNVAQCDPKSAPVKDLIEVVDEIRRDFDDDAKNAGDQDAKLTEQTSTPSVAVSLKNQAKSVSRLELAARVQYEFRNVKDELSIELSNSLEKAATAVAENGNPISQVKILRLAARHQNLDLADPIHKLLLSPSTWVRNVALNTASIVSGKDAGAKLAEDIAFSFGNYRSLSSFAHRLKASAKSKRPMLGVLATLSALTQIFLTFVAIGLPFFVTAFLCSYILAPTLTGEPIHTAWNNFGPLRRLSTYVENFFFEANGINSADSLLQNYSNFGVHSREHLRTLLLYCPLLTLALSILNPVIGMMDRNFQPSSGKLFREMFPFGAIVLFCLAVISYNAFPEFELLFQGQHILLALLIIAGFFAPVIIYGALFLLSCFAIGTMSALIGKKPLLIFSAPASAFPALGFGKFAPAVEQIKSDGVKAYVSSVWDRPPRYEESGFLEWIGTLIGWSMLFGFFGLISFLWEKFSPALFSIPKGLHPIVSSIGRIGPNYPNSSDFASGVFALLLIFGCSVFLLSIRKVKRVKRSAVIWFAVFAIAPPLLLIDFGGYSQTTRVEASSLHFEFSMMGDWIRTFFRFVSIDLPLSQTLFDLLIPLYVLTGTVALVIQAGVRKSLPSKEFLKWVAGGFLTLYGIAILFFLIFTVVSFIFIKAEELFVANGWGILQIIFAVFLVAISFVVISGFINLAYFGYVRYKAAVVNPSPDDAFAEEFQRFETIQKLAAVDKIFAKVRNGEMISQWLETLEKLESDANKNDRVANRYYPLVDFVQRASQSERK